MKGWSAQLAFESHLLPLLGGSAEAVGMNLGGDLQVATAQGSDWIWNLAIADPRRVGASLDDCLFAMGLWRLRVSLSGDATS